MPLVADRMAAVMPTADGPAGAPVRDAVGRPETSTAGAASVARERSRRSIRQTPERPAVPVRSGLRSPSTPPVASPPATAAASWALAVSLSTRTAVALNSAVPDFGSVASIVSTFTSISSGKWNVMNANPGRRPVDRAQVLDRSTARAYPHHLARLQPELLGVLRAQIQRLAPAQRRAVQVRLHAGVVGVQAPAGRQPDREVVIELVDRRRPFRDQNGARGSPTGSSHNLP